MKSRLRGRAAALLAFLAIAALVTGGLGWVTAAVLQLEREQFEARGDSELYSSVRQVLWRLDSLVAPVLARESSRAYSHYSAVHAPAVLFRNDGTPIPPGTVVEPSPLLSEPLPAWIVLHFQVDAEHGWSSPQVLSPRLTKILENPAAKATLCNVNKQRDQLRLQMAGCCNPAEIIHCVKERSDQQRWIIEGAVLPDGEPNPAVLSNLANVEEQLKNFHQSMNQNQTPSSRLNTRDGNDYLNRAQQLQGVYNPIKKDQQQKTQQEETVLAYQYLRNGEGWFSFGKTRLAPKDTTTIRVGAMVPLWLTAPDQEDRLLVARLVHIGDKQVCQGFVLDWPVLQYELLAVVRETFADARLVPMRQVIPPRPERTMTALPVELDPGPIPPAHVPLWTPLQIGLALAWVAALVALSAVGLGGWSLLSLSERRIRFVQAVTHELRTPLTTQRLYLDMLAGGLVADDRKAEYLQTLHAETDRLHRLVSNVLDFARLERQRPQLGMTVIPVAELVDRVRGDWHDRCLRAEKELIVENRLAGETTVRTDANLVQQILATLIDNACKYSKGADDRRIWLRTESDGKRLILEVEDRGPGVPPRERRSIFRPFRRGQAADVTAGGVGLGLALARQWARLLGGRLTVGNAAAGLGACFRLEIAI